MATSYLPSFFCSVPCVFFIQWVWKEEVSECAHQSHASASLPASALGPCKHWWWVWVCCWPPSARLWTAGHQSAAPRSDHADTNQSSISVSAELHLLSEVCVSCQPRKDKEQNITMSRGTVGVILSRNLGAIAAICMLTGWVQTNIFRVILPFLCLGNRSSKSIKFCFYGKMCYFSPVWQTGTLHMTHRTHEVALRLVIPVLNYRMLLS